VLADVAAADFRRSAGSGDLGHDPVVTAGGQQLRFEALSQCCGVHGRLDVLPAGLDGELYTRGTTNVDVDPELYTALSRVGEGDPLRLVVGPDHLAVTTLDGQVVEKRVPLPARWLRGLAESAVIGAGLEPRIELTGAALGVELVELLEGGEAALRRYVEVLTELHRAGAAAEVWAALRLLVPAVVVRATPGPGAPDLLALASAVASQLGVQELIAEVDVVAARGGSSRLVAEARRLVRTLRPLV
jgi:hypothetical protein